LLREKRGLKDIDDKQDLPVEINFDNPAGTKGDQWPEHGIIRDSGDYFDAAWSHWHDAGCGESYLS